MLIVNAISIMVAFLTHFPELITLSNPYSADGLSFPGMHWADVGNEVLFTYLSLLFLFFLNEAVFRFNSDMVSIGWKKVVCSFVLTWVVSNLLGKCFVYLHQHFDVPAIDAMLHHYLHPLRDFLITCIVTGSCYFFHQNRKSRKMLLENQQLRMENVINQYEALKSQLNPHMLFNSLNTLYLLIRESPDKARHYLEELSRVMRYTLQDNESHSVTLREEMEFVQSYMYLLQVRYEENLQFDIRIYPELMSRKLPPMALQLLVENAVKLLYRSVYADIEGLVFHSLESLNAAISESLSAFNGRRMSGRPQSRREQFEQIESDCLRPLPAIRHQMKERRSATVMRNGYVTFRLHHYSVPKEYIGKRVEIVYDADTLEIYHGLRLVTTHQRDDTPYSYTTKDAHGLPGRHGSYEKDLEQIYERAGQTDNVLLLYLRKVAELKKYPPAAFRSCRGIMALEKTFGLERLVAASACATQLRLYGYQEIRRILERGDDADFLSKDDIDDEVPVTSIHKNIRGAAYFAQLKHLNRDNNGNK